MKDELDFFFTASVINFFPRKISEILEKYIREPWIAPGDGFPEISKRLKERSYRFAVQKSKARAYKAELSGAPNSMTTEI